MLSCSIGCHSYTWVICSHVRLGSDLQKVCRQIFLCFCPLAWSWNEIKAASMCQDVILQLHAAWSSWHFCLCSLRCPMYKNPADFFLGVIKTKEVVSELADKFEADVSKSLEANGSQSQGDELLHCLYTVFRIISSTTPILGWAVCRFPLHSIETEQRPSRLLSVPEFLACQCPGAAYSPHFCAAFRQFGEFWWTLL